MKFEDIKFPTIRNIAAKTIADDLIPLTNEEVAEQLGKLFEKLEKLSGKKIVVEGGNSPIQSLMPDSHKENENENENETNSNK